MASHESSCSVNSFYNDCGTACQKQCGYPDPEVCIQICKKGCFCDNDNGFILSKDGTKCVSYQDCYDELAEDPKNSCPLPNFEFRDCGTACPDFCGGPVDIRCTKQCVRGCYCKSGYILSSDKSRCISENNCKLGENDDEVIRKFENEPLALTIGRGKNNDDHGHSHGPNGGHDEPDNAGVREKVMITWSVALIYVFL